MNLLDNELIKKYFGSRHESCPPECNYGHEEKMASRILAAMEEPIKNGDKYLDIHDLSNVKKAAFDLGGLHTETLKLPSRFQTPDKKECDHPFANLLFQASGILCCLCAEIVKRSCQDKPAPTPDPVEKKLTDLWTQFDLAEPEMIAIHELIDLVRNTKGTKCEK
jgi:hypothetical protein